MAIAILLCSLAERGLLRSPGFAPSRPRDVVAGSARRTRSVLVETFGPMILGVRNRVHDDAWGSSMSHFVHAAAHFPPNCLNLLSIYFLRVSCVRQVVSNWKWNAARNRRTES